MQTHSHDQSDPRNPYRTNIGKRERIFSSALGATLLAFGLKRDRSKRAGLSMAGMELIRRGLSGRSYLYRFLDVSTKNLRSLSHGEEKKRSVIFSGTRQFFSERVVTINKSRETVFQFWMNLENRPKYMENILEVTPTGNNRAHWVACGPEDTRLEWDTQTTDIVSNERVTWETIEAPGNIQVKGRVQFTDAPGDRGTEVRINLDFFIPFGEDGNAFLEVLGNDPDQQAFRNLRLFKKFIETGEIIQVEGQTSGRIAA